MEQGQVERSLIQDYAVGECADIVYSLSKADLHRDYLAYLHCEAVDGVLVGAVVEIYKFRIIEIAALRALGIAYDAALPAVVWNESAFRRECSAEKSGIFHIKETNLVNCQFYLSKVNVFFSNFHRFMLFL